MERRGGAGAVLTTIRTVAQTGSTNADLLASAVHGAADEGVWLRAERQTAGRGRQGRAWESPPGNFHGSTLIRLRPGDPMAATLSLVAGLAVRDAVAAHLALARIDAAPHLKWPNDLLVGRAKLAGILLERGGAFVVAGTGVNLAHHPDLADRPAASLAGLGAPVAPSVFAETLADCFARWLGRWRGEGLEPVRAAWLAGAHTVGTALRLHGADGAPCEGLFDGLTGEGALRLRMADGRVATIHAGDVFLV